MKCIYRATFSLIAILFKENTMSVVAESAKKRTGSREKGFWEKASVYFSEFTSNTSLHGFRYIGDRDRTAFERALWLILILISIAFCISLLTNTYLKWINTPIILVRDRESRPISTIPFPAITICPENKINKTVYNRTYAGFGQLLFNISEEAEISMLLCDDFLGYPIVGYRIDQPETIDAREFIHNISSSLEGIIDCAWAKEKHSCGNVLAKSFTEDGICYTFNGLTGDQIFADDVLPFRDFWKHNFSTTGWSLYDDYMDPKKKDTYPRRVFTSGKSSGFNFFFQTEEPHLDYFCRNLPEAYKVILHHPAELPRTERLTTQTMSSFMVEAGTTVSVAVVPKVTATSESLRSYSPKKRGCYYPNEKKLRYFKDYTQQKCEYECIQNVTFNVCGCFAYYMPMVNDTPICRAEKMMCMYLVKEDIASGGNGGPDNCNCLSTCSYVIYSAEASSYTYNLIRRYHALGENASDYSSTKISEVTIFFKESQYFPEKRSELFGVTEFISDCGGLFGLFVGFSLISLLEAIYFVSVRVIVNCRQYGRDRWYGSSELIGEERNNS